MDKASLIESGNTFLGIEFGSTRIKAILIDEKAEILASGSFEWENSLFNGVWTYSIEEIKNGLQETIRAIKKNIKEKYHVTLKKIASIGVSAMMHGYLAFDKDMNLLVPFRTWRNIFTKEASDKLSEMFSFPIPERWSIAHLYHAMMTKEPHVVKIDCIMTLSSYVHYLLTGKKIIGIGDASGIFPIDSNKFNYNKEMLEIFQSLVDEEGYNWKIKSILPKVAIAGSIAGHLTLDGAMLLDPDGDIKEGIPLCPPEGDAGTGMVATNSICPQTGNVSAGTSVFVMVVLDKALEKSYPGLVDMVVTPLGHPCAMVHANNCTGEYDKWISLFNEVLLSFGYNESKDNLYGVLLNKALEGDLDCGGLLPFNYISGESITSVSEGRPLFVRSSNSSFNLSNFMRAQLFSSLATLRIGMNVLLEEENVVIKKMTGHGGFFKNRKPGMMAMASALCSPITVMDGAGEGGAWGMAILALYMAEGKDKLLPEFLNERVFKKVDSVTLTPKKEDVEGYNSFLKSYLKGLELEKIAKKYV